MSFLPESRVLPTAQSSSADVAQGTARSTRQWHPPRSAPSASDPPAKPPIVRVPLPHQSANPSQTIGIASARHSYPGPAEEAPASPTRRTQRQPAPGSSSSRTVAASPFFPVHSPVQGV